MALTVKNLGAGKLQTSTSAAILAGSTTKSTLVKSIVLVNTDTVAHTVNLWLKAGATPATVVNPTPQVKLLAHITPVDFEIPANTQVVLDTELSLMSSTLVTSWSGTPPTPVLTITPDSIVGTADTDNVVEYLINGMERDV